MKLGVLVPMCLTDGLRDLSGAAKAGFEAVQVMLPGGGGRRGCGLDADALIAELRRTKLELAAVAVHAPLFGDAADVRRGRAQVRKAVDCAAALRAAPAGSRRPIVNWHAGGYLKLLDRGVDKLLAQLARSLKDVCAHARRRRVDVTVELTRMGLPDNADKFLFLRRTSGAPNLYACLDAANFTPDRDPLEVALRRLGPLVLYAHAKDVAFSPDGTVAAYPSAGKGSLDYDAFIAGLRRHTKCRYLLAEYMPDKQAVRSVVRFLKTKLGG